MNRRQKITLGEMRTSGMLSIEPSRNAISLPITHAVQLVQKELPIAECLFRVLINRNNDCLNMLVAPAFARG